MFYRAREIMRPGIAATGLLIVAGCGSGTGGSAEGEHAESPAVAVAPAESGGEVGEDGEVQEGGDHAEVRESRGGGEHAEARESAEDGEGSEHGEEGHDEGGEGEEGGEYVAKSATWAATRGGVRLVLSYRSETDSFVGTVENVSDATLCSVRVEVHLGGGSELGPTEPMDLVARQSAAIALPVGGELFESWTAHPEVSECTTP
ncbi:MAG: hypothetical protein RLN75_06940 [Longimicrobiales bacterium]